MFDIGWTEMAIIALVALIVIGPKDLPRALRSVGQWTRKARMLAREFQSGLDEMIREADLDDARKAIQSTRSIRPDKLLRDTIDPTGEVEQSLSGAPDKDDTKTEAGAAKASGTKPNGEAPAAEASDEQPGGEAAESKPTVITTPTQIAPGNSVKPPPAVPTDSEQPVPAAPESTAGHGDLAPPAHTAEAPTTVEPSDSSEKKTA
jgi:sec-independent protein translocase protein TatB